jgi:tRNA threonylcarbamoyladenosine biosynthesis protein TsaB
MANILLIDTAAAHTQVALANEGGILASILHERPNEQAAVLNELINNLLQQATLTKESLDAIAVNAGPGSYTGLRVGLGLAKGLCFALDLPLLLFNRLELLTAAFTDAAFILKARKDEGFIIAKRDNEIVLAPQHIFYQAFDWEALSGLQIFTDDEQVLNYGPAAMVVANTFLSMETWNCRAQERFGNKAFDDIAYSEPSYLKSAFTTVSKKKIL